MPDLNPELKKVKDGLKPKRKLGKILGLIFVFLFAITVVMGLWGYYQYNSLIGPVGTATEVEEIIIEIPRGASTNAVANLLVDKGLIHNTLIFKLYFKLKGLDGKIKPGEYALKANMSLAEISDKLVSEAVVKYSFTIPEGYNIKQIVSLLDQKGYIDKDKFVDLLVKGDFGYDYLKDLPAGENRLEGYLFPDTYKITKTTTEQEIIKMMLERFNKELTPDFLENLNTLNMSIHEAVTIASMIEREAKRDDERAKVSGVIHNRLKIGMKLQIDATIQYMLGEQQERILYKHLEIDSPYNTYKYYGLPIGPIGSPGKQSLQAAVNPADVDYLYYVVSEDGYHTFSRTFAEHNKAKAKYMERFKKP